MIDSNLHGIHGCNEAAGFIATMDRVAEQRTGKIVRMAHMLLPVDHLVDQ